MTQGHALTICAAPTRAPNATLAAAPGDPLPASDREGRSVANRAAAPHSSWQTDQMSRETAATPPPDGSSVTAATSGPFTVPRTVGLGRRASIRQASQRFRVAEQSGDDELDHQRDDERRGGAGAGVDEGPSDVEQIHARQIPQEKVPGLPRLQVPQCRRERSTSVATAPMMKKPITTPAVPKLT